MLTALIAAAVLVAFVAWALCRAAGRNTTFDEHAATACALLQPDAPIFTDAEQAAIDEIADMLIADEVDDLLAELFPTIRPAIPQEES